MALLRHVLFSAAQYASIVQLLNKTTCLDGHIHARMAIFSPQWQHGCSDGNICSQMVILYPDMATFILRSPSLRSPQLSQKTHQIVKYATDKLCRGLPSLARIIRTALRTSSTLWSECRSWCNCWYNLICTTTSISLEVQCFIITIGPVCTSSHLFH